MQTSAKNAIIQSPTTRGGGGADYALFDHMFKAFQEHRDFPISLREGLRMTLPGIYAAESARRRGEKLTIHYPWEPEFQADIDMIEAKSCNG